MRRTLVLCLLLLALGMGCNRSDDAGRLAEPTDVVTATPEPTPCVLDDVSTDDRERSSKERFSPVSDVRWSESAGCPRIVFEFRDHVPGYSVGYSEPPFSECGSGEEVDVEDWDASAYLSVRLEPSGTGDPETGKPIYKGTRDIDTDGEVLKHIRRICDFEAVNEWIVGLDEERPFDVMTLDDPSRLVIDVSQG
jgi:hypothetical protein